MASTYTIISGSLSFAVFWLLAVFPTLPLLPIGRTAGSLLSASLMVATGVLSPNAAYSSIDLPILGLLFATMTLVAYLDLAGLFSLLRRLLSYRSLGPLDFSARVVLVSAAASSLLTNDTSCFALTRHLLESASSSGVSPLPFLLALASGANVGSSATPIGNPQNLVIALRAKISFLDFVRGMLPASAVGVLVNVAVLTCFSWRHNVCVSTGQPSLQSGILIQEVIDHGQPSLQSGILIQEVIDHGGDERSIPLLDSSRSDESHQKRIFWRICVYLVTAGMLVAMLAGFNMSWSAICAALALVALDFKDAQPCLEKVSYSLLVFFCGMFMAVEGFEETGIPGKLWEVMEPYALIDSVSGLAVLSMVVIVLCNLISNVPTVLLLGSRIAESAGKVSPEYEKKAWLILAWVSTVSGNLTLLGSAANLIVCEQARHSPAHLKFNLSFWDHFIFGVPSTILVTAIGLALIMVS